jgi:hypothetical protein
MPDLAESLIEFIADTLDAEFPASAPVHVGEVIPQDTGSNYVWLSQSSEIFDEETLSEEVDKVNFNVEVVCANVATCRQWTAAIKTALRAEASHSAAWNGNAEFVTVSDASDDYVPVNLFDDDKYSVGVLSITFDL